MKLIKDFIRQECINRSDFTMSSAGEHLTAQIMSVFAGFAVCLTGYFYLGDNKGEIKNNVCNVGCSTES